MSKDFHPDSAGSYTSDCDRDDVLNNDRSNAESEDIEDVKLPSCSDLSMTVIHHCSACKVCTDNPHIVGCPYSCLLYLLDNYNDPE